MHCTCADCTLCSLCALYSSYKWLWRDALRNKRCIAVEQLRNVPRALCKQKVKIYLKLVVTQQHCKCGGTPRRSTSFVKTFSWTFSRGTQLCIASFKVNVANPHQYFHRFEVNSIELSQYIRIFWWLQTKPTKKLNFDMIHLFKVVWHKGPYNARERVTKTLVHLSKT